MERSPEKTMQQDEKADLKGKHEGVREGRPDRPLAAEGKQEHGEAKAPIEGNEGDAGKDVDADQGQDIAAGQTEQTETRDEVKAVDDEDKSSKAI